MERFRWVEVRRRLDYGGFVGYVRVWIEFCGKINIGLRRGRSRVELNFR